ncbi:MAG TPA: glutamate--tRNA ligase [Alphaproteobacteria bacterium]|nr:glutamate--tRNA ligase [Alphaproteobacteria bacterium]
MVKVRFAPSPTGRLHVGNARAALANWLFARRQGGRFLLRLDDTDRERSTEEFAEAIQEDLRWLGFEWDEYLRQSDRLARYAAAAQRLKKAERLYPCYESEQELQLQRAAQRRQGQPPRYDRGALTLGAADRARLEAEGRRPHWRFLLPDEESVWNDLVHGEKRIPARELSDPVLLRSDGQPLYTFTSVVDDAELAISHVIRGADHITNTAVQIALFRALGAEPPVFAHLPLLTDVEGQGLSKRLGSLGLNALRAEGVEPMAVCVYLARLGTGDPMEPVESLDKLAASFDIARYSRAPARFDQEELKRLSVATVHQLSFERAAPRLATLGIADATPEFWLAVRDNVEALSGPSSAELLHWHEVCFGALPASPPADPALAQTASALLPPEPWDGRTWPLWTEALKRETGRKGRVLFEPLRLALTQRAHGPELKNLLPLIGRRRAAARLRGEAA